MIEETISLEQKEFDKIIMGNSTVTQVVPTEVEKKIKRNEALFGKRIKQLQHIIKDDSYIPKGSTNSYHNFIFDMWQALVTGRKITPKMESAITKIVKSYAKHLKKENNPEYKKKKLNYIENTTAKLNMIKRNLEECNYTKGYKNEKLWFLDSIEKQVYSRGSLSVKQRKVLNGMYTQFTKKIEKNEKIKKRGIKNEN
jgi:hypothetical protein